MQLINQDPLVNAGQCGGQLVCFHRSIFSFGADNFEAKTVILCWSTKWCTSSFPDPERCHLAKHGCRRAGEDDYLWPWRRTKGVDPTVLDALEGEHVDLMSGMDKANELVGTACRSGEPADATAAADAVAAAAQVIYGDVEHEEGFIDQVVRPLLTDPGFKPVAKGLRKSSLPDAFVFFSWVKDDAESEHADFLHNLLPAPLSFVFANTFGRSYEREVAASWR